MSDSKPLIDPKELVPMAVGLCIGAGILVFFYLLANGIGLTDFVNSHDIPHQ
ncbi:MAG: hypothetical protein H6835_18325 [Planctomycetes bacterium]|nr:hypothetical protein [Planctomycetota bacterium]